MKQFFRAVRIALRYHWTCAGSVVCALLVAVLWSGNITTVYPIAEIAFHDQSLHDWVRDEIDKQSQIIAESQTRLQEIATLLPAAGAGQAALLQERTEVEQQRDYATSSRKLRIWLRDRIIVPLLPDDAFQTLVIVVGMLLAGTIVKSMFQIWQQVLVGRLCNLTTFNVRNIFFRHTLRMDVGAFNKEGSSELMSRFTYDLESLSGGLAELFGKFIREPLKMVACLIGAGLICWRLLFFSLLLAPLAAFLMRKLAKTLKRANRRAMEEMTQIYNILEETFHGMKVVKAFTMERHERNRFHKTGKKYYRQAMRIARYDSLTRPVTEVMGVATICFALLAGAYLVLSDATHVFGIKMCEQPLRIGGLLAFYGLLAGVSDPARKMSEVFSRIQRGAAAADRIYACLDQQPQIVDPPQPRPLPRHSQALTFERLSFEYTPGQPVLEGIDLKLTAGETVAIVGPNGCGKSTLANLIPRFYDPTAGRVLLDGVDLREVRLRDLRRQIGLVSQETLLFDDTVFNNILYGSPHATADEVRHAAQRAHAHRFITEKLEHGYDTEVGPRGGRLSGGQRQRIALARAILRDPAILILDEATSQIDLESEQAIHQALEQFTRGRTTLIITHRMSTLALADRIVVMQAGRILDQGTHQELLRRCDLYSRLYDIQLREIA